MLREYQKTAVERMTWSLGIPGGSVLSLPTGAGKTHIIAEFARRQGQPLLILVPSKELLMQDHEKLHAVVPENEIGLYSASVGSKEVRKYTLGTIQSAYKHPEVFNHYTTVIIDECDGVNPKNLAGMYNTFFRAIGSPKIIGLTATPYRLASFYRATGKRWQPWETVTTTKMITRFQERFWTNMIHVINTHELMEQGYLTPLTYKDMSFFSHEDIPTNKSASDFDLAEFDELIGPKEEAIAKHIVSVQDAHNGVLVFCTTIAQATRLSRAITGAHIVSSETPAKEREAIISGFKHGTIKAVFNVNVLTRGFDHPALDGIVMIRPTKSLNLYNQMLGRGTRLSIGKKECTVYDFSGNVKALGRLESICVIKSDNKWDVVSDARKDGYHGKELYVYKPRRKADHEAIPQGNQRNIW